MVSFRLIFFLQKNISAALLKKL